MKNDDDDDEVYTLTFSDQYQLFEVYQYKVEYFLLFPGWRDSVR